MIESKRLISRKITHSDFKEFAKMLKDIDVMYAWEHTFCDEQITASILVTKRLGRVRKGQFIKRYNGKDMVHDIFEINKTAAFCLSIIF